MTQLWFNSLKMIIQKLWSCSHWLHFWKLWKVSLESRSGIVTEMQVWWDTYKPHGLRTLGTKSGQFIEMQAMFKLHLCLRLKMFLNSHVLVRETRELWTISNRVIVSSSKGQTVSTFQLLPGVSLPRISWACLRCAIHAFALYSIDNWSQLWLFSLSSRVADSVLITSAQEIWSLDFAEIQISSELYSSFGAKIDTFPTFKLSRGRDENSTECKSTIGSSRPLW